MTDIKCIAKQTKNNKEVVLRSYNNEWEPRRISPYQGFHVYGRVLN